jgi:hypothetical protein
MWLSDCNRQLNTWVSRRDYVHSPHPWSDAITRSCPPPRLPSTHHRDCYPEVCIFQKYQAADLSIPYRTRPMHVLRDVEPPRAVPLTDRGDGLVTAIVRDVFWLNVAGSTNVMGPFLFGTRHLSLCVCV